jgi:glycosyltransferase involved in cell wall biosynthesis
MNILFLDQFSDPGGAQQCLLELLPTVQSRGWRAQIGLPGDGELFGRIREIGFETASIDCGPYRSGSKSLTDMGRFLAETPRLARRIGRLANRIEADLVYLNGPRLVPAAALANLRIPILFHSHSYLGSGAIRSMVAAALRKTQARVIAACEFVAEPWRTCVAPERLSVIYNGVAGPSARSTRPGLKAAPNVGCIGRIAPEKGQLEFLRAASLIHAALPACRFTIHGTALFDDAGSRRYDAKVRAAALAVPVDFAGWTRDIYSALANLDLLLVPSTGHEATARVIVEAFAACVPVIAFRSGGIPEVVDHGRTGFLASSAEEMARMAIDLLAASPERRATITDAARESWRRRFTLDRYRQQVLDVMCRAGDIVAASR